MADQSPFQETPGHLVCLHSGELEWLAIKTAPLIEIWETMEKGKLGTNWLSWRFNGRIFHSPLHEGNSNSSGSTRNSGSWTAWMWERNSSRVLKPMRQNWSCTKNEQRMVFMVRDFDCLGMRLNILRDCQSLKRAPTLSHTLAPICLVGSHDPPI